MPARFLPAFARSGLLVGALAALAACPEGTKTPTSDAGPVEDGPRCTADDAVEPACQDEQIQELFNTGKATGNFVNVDESGVFTTDVDATAGGFGGSQGFLYGRFTDGGLEKVDLSDEDSLASTDWDIAFRRFVVRLNSGPGGPSCVRAVRAPAGSTFDGLVAVPELELRSEAYYTDTCELVPDGSGLGTSPATVLSSYWTYPGCVAMSGNVYVVGLADGRHVKLEVLRYYREGQDNCDANGEPGTGSGNLQMRWAYLD